MSAWLATFHFLRPWWLLALAALPLLWLVLARGGAEAGAWRGVVDAHLLEHLLADSNEDARTQMPRWLAALAWTIACVALAGPAWEQLPQRLFQNRAARVFALELSASMAAQDVKPSRYERARYKLADLLKRSGDMQTALIAYAGDAFVVAPLTDDANTVANLVDALDPSVLPAPGNDAARAIELGVKLIKQAGLSGGDLLLLADSANTDALAAARRARDAGVRVSVLGIGSEQGAPVALPQGGFLKNAAGDIVLPKLDAGVLAQLAQAGGGRYFDPAADVDALLGAAIERSAAPTKEVEATTARFRDRGPWLLLALLPLAAFGFRRGWLMLLPLILMAHSAPASAFSWRDLWQRPDQQARAELDAGHAKEAQAVARDPVLRGAAAYRADDFASAAQEFATRSDADAAYNRGNALAKQKQYEQAIAAYEEALRAAPDMDDAKVNKKAVEDWLKNQQQQRQQNQQNQDAQNQQNRNQQNQDSQNQQQSGSSGDQQKNDSQQAQSNPQRDAQEQRKSPQQGSSKDQSDAQADREKSAQAQQAEQNYREKMSKELAQQQGKAEEQKPIRLGAREGDAKQDEHEQAVEQLLQRVPDDPGGLLRRKFQLEYQLRQHGGKPREDGR